MSNRTCWIALRLTLIGLMLMVLPAALALAEDTALPFRLKDFHLNTTVVDHGRANAEIVVPSPPEYAKLAEQVQSAILKATGTKLPIRNSSEIASNYGELLNGAPKTNLILIAGPNSNNVVTHLIFDQYCTLDTDYPGEGGYMVNTIHDPWGDGANAILLGGSDLGGVRKAVDQFCEKLPKGDTLIIPRTVVTQFGKGDYSSYTYDPSDEDIRKELEHQRTAFKEGQQGGLFTPIVRAGSAYAHGGKEGQAKLFRDLLYLEDDLRRDSPSQNNWGGASDFLFYNLITSFDVVEHSESLSDSDRERMTRIVLDFIHSQESNGYLRDLRYDALRHNHDTFPCLGFLVAGQYFSKYYHLPAAQQWINIADQCFRPMMKSFKSLEDCSAYGWISARHVSHYAAERPDFSWYTSGKADQAGDLWIMTTDNLGRQATFGDVHSYGGNGQAIMWSMLVDIERNGRYAWALRKVGASNEPDGKVHGVAPTEPRDLLGLKCQGTEPLFYEHYNGAGTVPQDRTFDKISFRTSFDPDKAYLLLDGINGGYHGHWDANSVLSMTDKGRIWLADCDYIKSLPRYHNSMIVSEDGVTGKMPPFCERELAADLAKTGFARTTMHDYSGADWRRNILWDKDGAFVFIDEVTAKEDNDYDARCYWHTLGVPKLDGNTFEVSQKGPVFSIQNLDGARLRRVDDPELGANWSGYSFADPMVHTLQQIHTRKLRAGQRICFINVLSTNAKGGVAISAQRVGDSAALIGSGDNESLVGVRSGSGVIADGLETDAGIYWVSSRRIALGQTSRAVLNGESLFAARDAISIEFAPDGTAMVVAEKPTLISVPASPIALRLDSKPVASAADGKMTAFELPVGRHQISGLTLPSVFVVKLPKPSPAVADAGAIPAGAKKLTPAADPVSGKMALALAADENGLYIGREDGRLYALTTDAKPRWSFGAGSAVTAVWVGKLAKEDPSRIAVGTKAGTVFLLDESGSVLWKQQLPIYKAEGTVEYFMSGDLAGDGNRALIVGADNWHHYAFGAKGDQIWSFESIRGSTAGTTVDLNGDGRQEAMVANEYNQIYAVNPNGMQKWQVTKLGGPRINAVAACVLNEGSKPSVVFGGAEGNLYALDADGNKQWSYGTGDEITCMQLADLDGDGAPEILAGSRSFSLNAVKRDGTRLWRKDVGEPILSMALVDLNGDGSVEIAVGTEDGHVIAVDRSGSVLASWSASGAIGKLAAVPGSPARLAAACSDGRVVLLGL